MTKERRTVMNKYPSAKVSYDFDGNCTIVNDDINISEDFYMPLTSSEEEAWKQAAISIRTKQNFNRTHPNRMDLSTLESKMNRLDKRRKKHGNKKSS
jgi:hypothetical protein